ncbi:hypothetical protein K2173_018408 [Erythroxylum novogranatense]|uniref:G domain-containing protein n=1 Tax=Erythroxylum novogranatense TaxID=1862640 RepID=A0AAV8UAD4_9ROSI|nr:hypothetical protein K2173_018408 [Erythroxylum novogranatense]
MLPLLTLPTPKPSLFLSPSSTFFTPLPCSINRTHRLLFHSSLNDTSFQPPTAENSPIQQPPRTLFPGGFKRPEIRVPSIVLQLHPDDILSCPDALNFVDRVVSKWVGIVVLNAGDGSGKRLYDAACLLKSVLRDRAFFLIGERVDIVAAVNASGVVLSDQGLPAIVARNMMMDSKSESVVLPLVARIVKTPKAAFNASNAEGADFLIFDSGQEKHLDLGVNFGLTNVKIPIFYMCSSLEETTLFIEGSNFPTSGASGLVMWLEDLRSFSDDDLSRLLNLGLATEPSTQDELEIPNELKKLDLQNDHHGIKKIAGFVKLKDREKQLVETEKSLLFEAIDVMQKAAPMMEEVSLLIDAVSQIDEPFLLAIVGEFNSGKSTVINALLGESYLKEGVIPTTNEITFLRYSKYSEEQQRCERHPDGQYICYLPAPILKEINIVDTPGTNVILQRQQRLTEEFVPRADLLLFVISADRPLTESEVAFLRYTQQWKKKVVFVLNKSDLYQSASELEEAISFIKENARKLLNAENVMLYPVSARSALQQKLSASSSIGKDRKELLALDSHWKISSFYELEQFLYSFLDGSTRTGMERMKLKLETPIAIAERLFSSCETLLKEDCLRARQDLTSATELVESVRDYAMKMENESIAWRRKALSLIDATKSRVIELIKSTLQLSSVDVVSSYIFKGEKPTMMPGTLKIQNDVIGPGLLETKKLLGEYLTWLQSSNVREGKLYKESFSRRWPSFTDPNPHMYLDTYDSLKKVDELSLRLIEDFNVDVASKLFEQEIREVYLGSFGGLGAAGLSASLLTSVLPSTLEDLLALGLCSAAGYIAIASFPGRKQAIVDKVNRIADGLAREIENAMQKDLGEAVGNLENFVKTIGKPYQDAAQVRLDKLLHTKDELSNVEKKLRTFQVEIQNLHILS